MLVIFLELISRWLERINVIMFLFLCVAFFVFLSFFLLLCMFSFLCPALAPFLLFHQLIKHIQKSQQQTKNNIPPSAYTDTHTHTHTHTHTQAHTHTHRHARTHARTYARTHARAHTHTHTHTHTRTHARTHTLIHTHTHTHTHTRTHAHTCTHTHTHTLKYIEYPSDLSTCPAVRATLLYTTQRGDRSTHNRARWTCSCIHAIATSVAKLPCPICNCRRVSDAFGTTQETEPHSVFYLTYWISSCTQLKKGDV